MATRSSSRRRTGGGSNINLATITFLSVKDLKERCAERGLPTNGSKATLARRLEDFVSGAYVSPSVSEEQHTPPKPSPKPTPKASASAVPRGRKRSNPSTSPGNETKKRPQKTSRETSEEDVEEEKDPLADEETTSHPALENSRKRSEKEEEIVEEEEGFIFAPVKFATDLTHSLENLATQQRNDETEIEEDVAECVGSLIYKVENKAEKELKWAQAARRIAHNATTKDNEACKQRARTKTEMLKDPKALLAKASHILRSMQLAVSPTCTVASILETELEDIPLPSPAMHIAQIVADPGSYEEDKEERAIPTEFHGEPVPSDDEEALFREAAGLPRKDKKPKHPVVEEEAPPSHERVEMDYYNACLHVKCGADGRTWLIDPENADGLALMWGGVRTNHGIMLPWSEALRGKKLVYQIKMVENLPLKHVPFNEIDPHDVRIGFSLRTSNNVLGEFANGWCYSTTGRKATNNIFKEYGDPAHIGDVVTAIFDFERNSITFLKNGVSMGVAYEGLTLPEGDAIFPHLCVKNVKVAVNLGDFPDVEGGWEGREEAEEEDNDEHISNKDTVKDYEKNWIFPAQLERMHLEMSKLPPSDKSACTILMMVGLPGVGKTTWVRQYIRDHPAETWNVVNAETIMSAMKVHGVARARVHTGRWDMVLGLVAKALGRQVLLAARRRRNYILDMSNVSKESRKRRLMHFKEFTKKCIVIIPNEDEMVSRQMKQARQEGVNLAPPEAMLEMKAVLAIPSAEAEGVEEVHFIEPPIDRIVEALDIVARFNDEGRPWYQTRYRGRGGRRGGRGGFSGIGVRRGSDVGRPLSMNTSGLNGSGPPSSAPSSRYERRSNDCPSARAPSGMINSFPLVTPSPLSVAPSFLVPSSMMAPPLLIPNPLITSLSISSSNAVAAAMWANRNN